MIHCHKGVASKSPHGKTVVDLDKYQPIARLGGLSYGRINEVLELPRPSGQQLLRSARAGASGAVQDTAPSKQIGNGSETQGQKKVAESAAETSTQRDPYDATGKA